MPLTPETWLNEFVVNLTTNGSQFDPSITQLANGNILVSWTTSDAGGLGSPVGNEVFAQLFDPMGNRIGVEFRLNAASTADNEQNSEIAALPNGGFIVVYHDVDEPANGGASNIRLEEYDSTGALVTSNALVVNDTGNSGFPTYRNPQVAVSSNTSVLVVYEEELSAGNTTIVGKIYNPTTDTYGPQINLIAFAGGDTDPDVTVLNNGNYVITGTHNDGGDNRIIIRIVSSTGANVLGVTPIAGTDGDAANDRDASVTALTGGGFVVTWTSTDANDTDIEFQVFNSAGTAVVGGFGTVTSNGATDNGNEPVVVALNDGGFVVIYDEDTEGNLSVERFDSAGNQVGNEFIISTGASITSPDAKLLEDGRIAVTFVTQGGEIGMEIIDIRDTPNNGVYTPDQWQIGTVGDDVFTADASSEFVHGHSGNDTITEAGQIRQYFGDAGNDTLIVASGINDDLHNGGTGNDTIDWSGTGISGATFNLDTGLATAGGQDEQMISIENLIGTGNDDIIIAGSGSNDLFGGGGNDTIRAGFGEDSVDGGAGDDIIQLFEGEFGDNVDGGTDNDTLDLSGLTAQTVTIDMDVNSWSTSLGEPGGMTINNVEIVIGGGGDDSIRGTNGTQTFSGGGGGDTLEGGLNADTLNGNDGNDSLFANTAANQTGSTVGDVMNGGAGNDTVVGSNGGDTISGGADADSMVGNDGDDAFLLATGDGDDTSMDGGLGTDRIVVQSAIAGLVTDYTAIEGVQFADTAGATNNFSVLASEIGNGLASNLVVDFAAAGFQENLIVEMGSQTSLDLSALTFLDFVLADKDGMIVNGDTDAETIIGSNVKDVINGGDGNDSLNGGLAFDRLAGGDGNDTYFVNKKGEAKEAVGEGRDTVNAGINYTLGANIEKLVLTGAGNINGKGNASNNTINGNTGNNTLSGADGNDKLNGGTGDDKLLGGNGNDVLNGGTGADVLTGGLGRDKMNGGLDADLFDFNAVAESGLTAATRDLISAFDAGTNVTTIDRIDLQTIDANTGVANNQTFTFGGAFTAGHIQVVQSGTSVLVRLNTDADATAEMVIEVQNQLVANFNASDFVL